MSTPKAHTPTGLPRSRFGPLSPAQRVARPDLESKVRVVVRIRPFLAYEIEAAQGNPKPCLTITKPNGILEKEDTLHLQDVKTSRSESYKFDFCYGQEDEVGQIFLREVDPILPVLFRGSNATVFAYGATGSGKTYTMQGTEERPGLMPLAMRSIISMAECTGSTIEISYYEVYMDRCYDLLVEQKSKEIPVLEDSEGRVQLRGLAQVPVKSLEEFQEVFSYGCMRRKVGHTGLNDVSSRSHGVLMISVSSDDGNPDMPLVGKLNLIDLAGNEDNRRSGNEGIRLTESVKINQSLFALSNVIHALNANESRVPYRDSKLTRILQDSLGGNSRALMIACLNPSSFQEALHTVSLAARSRQIGNHVSLEGKQDSPRPKMDMNARLNAWLEAKGKTNGKAATPGSLSAAKIVSKQTPNRLHSVLKARTTNGSGLSTPKGRLFGTARRVKIASTEEIPEANSPKDGQQADLQSFSPQKSNNCSTTGGTDEASQSNSLTCAQSDVEYNTLLDDKSSDKENRVVKEYVLEGSSPPLSARLKQLQSAFKEMLTPKDSSVDQILPLNVTPYKSSGVTSSKAEQIFPSSCSKCCGIPLSNTEQTLPMNFTSGLKSCEVTLEAATPSTPLVEQRGILEENSRTGTPLSKWSVRSSGLKRTLAQEYLNFLNTASREELLELKGIGERRADHILELRETSPEALKELHDLEKIGLSSKQIQNMFKSTARQVFG
ncbi:kinesin-like protein KIN-10C isoform X2 [Cryptomeria japonica]|uniref:kinesin-like protein KIN-10C isoform X2 n=1 Tax=Cryptomeria japonica TaxID=3369 RepID=UPI0025ABEEC5|nr:kinesin-like protein KIN-10C isoform X2 [Cryptomeria japonica]